MRNRAINESRSPRSRVQPLDEDLPDPEADGVVERLDIAPEVERLRLALDRLPEPQRFLLHEVHGAGRKPGDLVQELDRTPAAVHSLHARAKRGLRRAYLQVVLEEGAPPTCQHALDALPAAIGDSPETTVDVPEHMRECERCREGWRRFVLVATAFGLLPLFVIAEAARVPGAAAAEVQGENQAGGSATEIQPDPAAQAPASHTALAARLSDLRTFKAGLAVAATGVTIAVVAALLQFEWRSPQEQLNVAERVAASEEQQSNSRFTVTSEAPQGTLELTARLTSDRDRDHVEYELDIEFALDRGDWVLDALEFSLPGSLTLASAPAGWHCDGTSCVTDAANPMGGQFLVGGSAETDAEVSVQWAAISGQRAVLAEAGGTLPASGQELHAVARPTAPAD